LAAGIEPADAKCGQVALLDPPIHGEWLTRSCGKLAHRQRLLRGRVFALDVAHRFIR
jgi:hypothetical protein